MKAENFYENVVANLPVLLKSPLSQRRIITEIYIYTHTHICMCEFFFKDRYIKTATYGNFVAFLVAGKNYFSTMWLSLCKNNYRH